MTEFNYFCKIDILILNKSNCIRHTLIKMNPSELSAHILSLNLQEDQEQDYKQQQIVLKYPHRKRIMVFDVETTGLLPKKDPVTKAMPLLADFPHILQLSFVIYNTKFKAVERTFNKYIRVADSVEISPKIVELTGITRELCNSPDQSISIEEALSEFYHEYCNCDRIVAHNIDFDRTMIKTEMARWGPRIMDQCPYYSCIFDDTFNKINTIDTFCTMRVGKKICNIVIQPANKVDPKTGLFTIVPKPFVKYPRLSELHQHLFGTVPEGLHNSLVDTMACLHCFLKIQGTWRFPPHVPLPK